MYSNIGLSFFETVSLRAKGWIGNDLPSFQKVWMVGLVVSRDLLSLVSRKCGLLGW